ncbi:MAG TPA: GMC family oxidoreductase N-terminal domain-containing protein [Spirochaetota bacterium]|nr:GMC family oxidoreductase N-terminal domain-containing protein [Spirochaetota bacterium]HPJ38970.1 GMC family oxidoreductase N-terminal domain-containing protein [Spirochaetota bacterium]HPQ53598.1 GMC family oxidoreductase N-terminal domain-containing protein [Spirochaetota bacterium]
MEKMIQNTHFDAIVAGSGPGGATVAKELAKQGKKVLLLEWGSGEDISAGIVKRLWQAVKWLGIPGRGLLFTTGFLGMVRGICKGGSSVFYYASCFKVPHDMLKRHGIDVTAEEKEARKELPIGVLKDEMMTPMASKLMKCACDLGYPWKKIEKFMYQDKWSPGYPFGYYGDPGGVKWSARMQVDDAVARGAVFLDRARVKHVVIRDGKAEGVVFKRGGREYSVFGSKIIIAAGGIGTPVILRASGMEKAGYDFFYDPLISVCGVVKDITARRDEIPMSGGFHNEEEGYVMTDMALPYMIDAGFSAEVFRFHRIFSRKKTLRIMVKIRDSLGGKLTDSGGVRKGLAPEDRMKLDRGYEAARKILEKAGARGIFRTWYLAAHPGGTVKIGDLLDSNLRTEYENLYVCDCSVIPEPWGLPPVMTLVCLGKRLAKHLAGGEVKKKSPAKKAAGKKQPRKKSAKAR